MIQVWSVSSFWWLHKPRNMFEPSIIWVHGLSLEDGVFDDSCSDSTWLWLKAIMFIQHTHTGYISEQRACSPGKGNYPSLCTMFLCSYSQTSFTALTWNPRSRVVGTKQRCGSTFCRAFHSILWSNLPRSTWVVNVSLSQEGTPI